ncbi:MAG: septal ring lytic transglycosylase RlpA family protein [Methylococcales bacterium]
MYNFSCSSKHPLLNQTSLKQPGFILLLVFLVLNGCTSTTTITRKSGPTLRDGLPDHPIDVSGLPDAIPRSEPKSMLGNPSSYVVWGRRYYVMNDSKKFVQRGVASWYGSKFHGQKTSSGERYDMYAMTAAHRTLPIPSYVQVKNLKNGRAIVVRVNDRGPFHSKRIVDLSYSAAKKLGMVKSGTGYVEIRDLTPARATVPVTIVRHRDSRNLYIQIGAFKNRSNADKLLYTIDKPGLPDTRINTGELNQEPVYRVQLGPVASFGEAQRVIAKLGELGFTSTRIVSDPGRVYSSN